MLSKLRHQNTQNKMMKWVARVVFLFYVNIDAEATGLYKLSSRSAEAAYTSLGIEFLHQN